MENILLPSLSGVCDPEFFESRALLLMFILKNFCVIDKQRLKDFMTKIQVNGSLTFNPIPTPTSPQCLQFQRSLERALEEMGSCGCDSFFDAGGLKQPPCQQTAQTKNNPLKNPFSSLVRTFESPPEPSMPSRYANEFEELGFIGKGGFGSVVKAKNKIDGSHYAIKKIKFRDFPILDDGATRKKKFGSKAENVLREVTALAKLDHPNVARYYTAWIEKDCKFSNASSSKRNYFFSQSLTLLGPQKKQSSSGSESSVKNGSNVTSYTHTNTKTVVNSKNTSKTETDNNHNNSNNHNDSYNHDNTSSFTKINDKNYDRENSEDGGSEAEEEEEDDDVIEFGDTSTFSPKIVKEPVVLGKLWQNDSSLVDSTSTSIVNNDTTVQTTSNINETNSINEIERSNTLSLIPYGGRNMLFPQISSPERSQSSPTQSLQSPPTPHSVSKDRYTLFIQMQLYSPLTLKDFLEQPDRVIDRQHNLFLLRQLIDGLNHIHSKKFIHRDLKPANIFIDQEGGLRIGDFGLSKEFWGNVDDGGERGFNLSGNNFFKKGKTFAEFNLVDSSTSSTSNHTAGIGTRSYASPEQTLGHFYSTKSDIYSLGIILVELYSLFGTASERACVLSQARKGILPERMRIKYPLEAALAQKMLQLDPKDRPSTEQLLVLETLYPSPLKPIFTEDFPQNSSAIVSVQKSGFYDDSDVEIYGFSKSMGELILKQVIHSQKIEIQMLRMLLNRCTCQFNINPTM